MICLDARAQWSETRPPSVQPTDEVPIGTTRRFPALPKFGSDWREADMQQASRARPMLCKKNGARAVQRMFGRSTLQAPYKSTVFHRQRSDVSDWVQAATGSASWQYAAPFSQCSA